MSSSGGNGRPPYPPLPGARIPSGPRRSSAQSLATTMDNRTLSGSVPLQGSKAPFQPFSMTPRKRPAESSPRGNSPPGKQTKIPESRNDASRKYVSPTSPVGQSYISPSTQELRPSILNAPTGPAARTKDGRRIDSYRPDQRNVSSTSQTRNASFDGRSPLNITMSPVSVHGETAAPGSGASTPVQIAPVAPSMTPSVSVAPALASNSTIPAGHVRNTTRTRNYLPSELQQKQLSKHGQATTPITSASLKAKHDRTQQLVNQASTKIIATPTDQERKQTSDTSREMEQHIAALEEATLSYKNQLSQNNKITEEIELLRKSMDDWKQKMAERLMPTDNQVKQISSRVDGITTKFSSMDGLTTKLASRVDGLASELDSRVDGIISEFSSRVDSMATKLNSCVDGMDTKLNRLVNDMAIELNSRADVMTTDIHAIHKEVLDAKERAHTLEIDQETLQKGLPKLVTLAIQEHQQKSEPSLTDEHPVVQALMQHINRANDAIQGININLQHLSNTTQFTSAQLEIQRTAFSSLEDRYQEITTDAVYQKMVNYWVTTYPDAARIFERLGAVQQQMNLARTQIAQLDQTLGDHVLRQDLESVQSALQTQITNERSQRMVDHQKFEKRVEPIERKVDKTNDMVEKNQTQIRSQITTELSQSQAEQQKLEQRITSIEKKATELGNELLVNKDQIYQAVALVPHLAQELARLKEIMRSINENCDHPLNLEFASST